MNPSGEEHVIKRTQQNVEILNIIAKGLTSIAECREERTEIHIRIERLHAMFVARVATTLAEKTRLLQFELILDSLTETEEFARRARSIPQPIPDEPAPNQPPSIVLPKVLGPTEGYIDGLSELDIGKCTGEELLAIAKPILYRQIAEKKALIADVRDLKDLSATVRAQTKEIDALRDRSDKLEGRYTLYLNLRRLEDRQQETTLDEMPTLFA